MNATDKIRKKAFEIIGASENGIRYSELINLIRNVYPNDPKGTVTGAVWNLDAKFPNDIYKPARGLFKLTKYKEANDIPESHLNDEIILEGQKIKETDFYDSFADWLVNELEECSKAISLGGNKFGGKWATPDVIGIKQSREHDIIKLPIEIVSAEIKLNSKELITAFGQACSYKLFSHRSYLVVPKQSGDEDIARLDSLCMIFGIGLILYDSNDSKDSKYQIRTRAVKNEPDSYYANANLKLIGDKLF